ncbi:hypothetical protein HanXRQr2_Chr06g0275371 [Helianthus annuus]|uniref:Uncharacterized protein n=1 Tax=Helianthus annuus TaxID=4232 RepID=A0A9K3IV98_HELAN|nr:hypothetical protein HanXRQr2_Chr06g0275371 [Helianthus annuus]KAJ0916818.1 hypothetical protein HanPSC8_Chr06g0266251 [Helianthus annuus]
MFLTFCIITHTESPTSTLSILRVCKATGISKLKVTRTYTVKYLTRLVFEQNLRQNIDKLKQQQQPYPVNPTNSKATYRVWGGWDVDRPCLYPYG